MKRKIIVFATVFFLMFFTTESAHCAPATAGTDFYIVFPLNFDGASLQTLFITGGSAASGNVSVSGSPYTSAFTVTPGAVTTITLPAGTYSHSTDIIEQNVIHITADKDITVYGSWDYEFTTDAFLALPVSALGTGYFIMSYPGRNQLANPYPLSSEFSIAATQDNTTLEIIPAAPSGIRPAGVPYQVTMNAGDSYQLWADLRTDLTGTRVISDKPIAVFSGAVCTDIPLDHVSSNYLVEQLPPVDSWGTNFFTVPLRTRLNGDTFRILASEDSTDVWINTVPVCSLNAGQFCEGVLTFTAQIISDKPVLIAQYSNSANFDFVNDSDPSMVLITPSSQYLKAYTYATVPGIDHHYLNLIVPSAYTGQILLDGTFISASVFHEINSSGYFGASIAVTPGTHNINSAAEFGVMMYGFSRADAYSHPGGGAYSSPTVTPTVTITHTITISVTATMSRTPTCTATATLTNTFTATATPTRTLTSSQTQTPTATATASTTNTPDLWSSATSTPSITHTLTCTSTLTASPTLTPTLTASITATFSATASVTQTMTAAPTHTSTPGPLVLTDKGTYPNPFISDVHILYSLTTEAEVEIKIYTVSGEIVLTRTGLHGNAGINDHFWDGRNKNGKHVASGVFICRVTAVSSRGEKQYFFSKLSCVR